MIRAALRVTVAAVLLAGGYVVVNQLARQPNTTMTMPRPKSYPPNADGRVYAVIQLCWRPAQVKGAVHYIIGSIDQALIADNLDCRVPFQRKGLVSNGDRLAIAWAVDPGQSLRMVHYRFTINGHPAMDGEDMASSKLYACIVGTPPCTY